MTTLYGISNCDTVRKARKWLEAHHVDYAFHDFRKDGVPRRLLQGWIDEFGWEVLLNRRGATWRNLPEADRQDIDTRKALELMQRHPAIIKRPVLDTGKQRHVGFSDKLYADLTE
jgi:arsenate reductase